MLNKPELPFKEQKPKKFTKNFTIGLVVSIVVAALASVVVYLTEISSGQVNSYVIWADTFTIPGLLFILSYFMVVVSNAGAFDMLNYSIGLAWNNVFHKSIRDSKYPNSYAEYKELKHGKEKNDMTFILYTGFLFFLIGAIFLVLYYVYR